MPTTETKAKPLTAGQVATAHFEAIARRDIDAMLALGAPGYVEDFVATGLLETPEEIGDYFRELFAATPDFDVTVERIVSNRSSAVVQWRLSGTFSGGPFEGVAATGDRVNIRGVDVMDVANGKIVRNTIYYDGMSFARQIGMLPHDSTRTDRALKGAFNTVTRVRRLLPF